jgi:hypothetical protein
MTSGMAKVAVVAWSALPYPTWSVEGLIEAIAPSDDYERFERARRLAPAAIPQPCAIEAEGLAEAIGEILGAPLAQRAASVLFVPFSIDVFDRDDDAIDDWDFDDGVGETGAVHRVFADGADHLVVDLARWLRLWRGPGERGAGERLGSVLAELIPQSRALGLPLLVSLPTPEPLPSSDPLLADLDAALGAWGDEPLDEPEPEPATPVTVLVVHPVHDAHRAALDEALRETALDHELSPERIRVARSEVHGGAVVLHLRSDRHASATDLLRSIDAMLDPPLEGSFGATLSGRLIDAAPDAPGCTVWTLTDDGAGLSAREGFMYTSEETPSAACLAALGRVFARVLRPGWARELRRTPFAPLGTAHTRSRSKA